MTTKIKWTLLAIVLLQLATAKSQNSRSYDTSEWIPITKSASDDATPKKKPSGRVLNIADNTNHKYFFPEEKRTRNKPAVEQYLRETTQVAPQKDYIRQSVRFQENERPKVQEQPKYYLIPKQREHLYLQQQEQQLQRQQLISPQYALNTEPYLNEQPLKNPYDPNSYFVPPTPPLNLSLSPYQPLHPDTINQGLIAALSKPAATQVVSTTPRPKEEKETVQLLYVPLETLTKKEQPQHEAQHNWNEETRREPQYLPQQQHRLQGIQTDFAKQALEAHRLQMQLQAGSVPVIYTTTPKPLKKRKPHQPPLSLYMGANHDVDISDVLEELKHADTIAVQDNVGPDTPKVFVGPSNLDVPHSFAKFELPYLNSIDHNRIERKIEHLPFFVAPLSYRAPPGYSKIPLPSPHVGSVVVSTKATHEVASKKPQVVEEEEDDSSEETPLYKYEPKYGETSEKSEVDDEINRRLEQTESLFENQASKKQPVSLTVRSKTTTKTINPDNESEQSRSTTQAPRHVDARPTKTYSFEEPQNVRITTEHVRSSRPRTYTYSFEEPDEVHSTSERPSRPRTYQREEEHERATSVRPSRPVTYSFEEPEEIRITTPRPSSLRTYSFEEQQPAVESTERPRHPPSRSKQYSTEEEPERKPQSYSKQYSTEEEPERKPQSYKQRHREEDDEEVSRRPPQRTSYPTTERVRFVEEEPTQKEESEVTYKKPPRENQSREEVDEERPRRKPSRTRERVESDEAPPRRQSSEEETVRSTTQLRYEQPVKRPVEHSSEEREDDDSEARERPTKVTYEDTVYQSTPERQTSSEEPKQPYQTSNRFASTTPVYIVRTTEDDNEKPAYYSPTPTNYQPSYRTEEEYNVRSSTPRYMLQKGGEEPQLYSVTTSRPVQVSPNSGEQSYEAKFAPYLNLDVHVKAPGLHDSSIYDLADKKQNGPNPYEQEYSKSADGNRESYNLPSHLPPVNPEIPGLINNLQDQSIRQLLVPGLLVPTTEQLPVYKRPETTTAEYTSVVKLEYTTTTPEPIIETTTQKRTRSRQRGGSRFSLSNNRDSGETTSPPRTRQRSRRPHTRQRAEHRREEHEHTTEYTPVRATHDYTTTEASRRDITHSPRQRIRSRRPPHRESIEESRRVEESPRTTQPTPPPPPQSYIQFDRDQSTENILQRSGQNHPVTELKDYHQVYSLPLQQASASSKEDSRPQVDVHVTHPEEHTTQQQYQSPHTQASSSEERETVRQYIETTTTPKPRSRQRIRGRARVASSTTTATRKPTTTTTTTTTTTKPQVKGGEQEEFYGFIRPPSFNKPSPPKPTEAPAYTDFDKRFKIPSYTFDFPSYHYPSSQNQGDYYKEVEAAGREPIQLYTNDKHLSTTPLYVFKPKFVPHTEEQDTVAPTDDPLKQIKEEARENTKLRVLGLPKRKQNEEGIRRAGSRRNEVSTEAQKDSKTARTRGRTHFQLPASLRTASEEAEVQGGNYPADFLQQQASATQSSVFQITVEPQAQDAEYDQQPFSSIQRPSIALPDEPNAVARDERRKAEEEVPSTVQPIAEETATTVPPTETTTEAEKKNGRRRGVWKLVKQRPLDNFETAESQNFRTALQLTSQDQDNKKDKASLLDTLYEMFSSPQKDEASTEATTASSQTQVGNNTSSEEVTTTTAVPETEATTITIADEASTISETATTETANAEEAATEKVLKPYEVAPWEMKAVKTSTTTEVSHETEICFRGRCVKSSGIAETP